MKKVLRITAVCLVIALAVCCVSALSGCKQADEELIVYNWGDYIDESVCADFEAWYENKTGKSIEVVYDMFETNEEMIGKLELGSASYDVICPSEYAIERLINKNLLKKIDKTQVSTIGNVHSGIYAKTDEIFQVEINDYFVPYMWGTLGILYNTAKVSEAQAAEAGWGLLWNETGIDGISGKIMLKDSIRDTYAAAVLYLKEQNKLPAKYADYTVAQLINCTETDLVNAAKAALKAQKSVLDTYEVDEGKGEMIDGTDYVSLSWSGDAFYSIEEAASSNNIELAYFVPEVGGNVWFDGWVIPTCCNNSTAAHAWIEYMCMPEVSIKNAMYIEYISGVDPMVIRNSQAAVAILEENDWDVEEFLGDELKYPDISSINLGVMTDFGNAYASMDTMWREVKSYKAA